jgi:hypothetical protein
VFSAPLPQASFVFGNPFVRSQPVKDKPQWISKADALVFLNDAPLIQVTAREQLIKTPGSWMSSNDGQQLLVHLPGDAAPAKGAVEITTRDRIFAPHRRALGYINVEGFVFERCATRPDWPQLGALSTRTGHHWTIRNNIVRDTTGKGIDCGSETWSPEEMIATEKQDQHILIGGHHLVEANLLERNAQCGIAAWNTDFVRIVGNIVRHNAARGGEQPIYYLADAEAAGIKVHAFRDGVIQGNLVMDNSSFGIWLDDGWENARVTRNVAVANRGAGLFVELGFGPVLVDHNLSANNIELWPPYLGDGIYSHDASGVTIAHNTFLDNAHDGVHQLVVTERSYANRRLCEASNETILANFFCGNRNAAICLPLDSPRSRDNHCDHNAIESSAKFVINDNQRRIPLDAIVKSCREQLEAAHVPQDQRPTTNPATATTNRATNPASHPADASDPTRRLPRLSLTAWRVVMQMDENSTPLAAGLAMHLDKERNQLQVDRASADAIPTAPAGPAAPPGPADDFDLLGQPLKPTSAHASHAGAIENLPSGAVTIRIWPLPQNLAAKAAPQ